MRTVKYVLTLLLAVLLVAAGAILPYAVAEHQDRKASGEAYSADMEPLELEIRELTLKEKTRMLSHGSELVEVSTDAARISADALPEVIAEELLPYQDSAIISPEIDFAGTEEVELTYQPMLCYDDGSGQSFILWTVSVQSERFGLQLGLDDATGAILVIEFWTTEPCYSDNVLYDVLLRLYQIYFTRLEMGEEVLDFFEFEPIAQKNGVMIGWFYEEVGYHFTASPESFSIELN